MPRVLSGNSLRDWAQNFCVQPKPARLFNDCSCVALKEPTGFSVEKVTSGSVPIECWFNLRLSGQGSSALLAYPVIGLSLGMGGGLQEGVHHSMWG